MTRYALTINGLWCRTESVDDPLDFDGFSNEVFFAVNTRKVDQNGNVLETLNSESAILGDTWRFPNRVQAGTRRPSGGIQTGDRFPSQTPWFRDVDLPLNVDRVPPFLIWEGELDETSPMYMITPTIWEWDLGPNILDAFINWQVGVDAKYGKRAKDIFGGIWPVSKPVFDAVSLGIETVGSMFGPWSLFPPAVSRPIGLQRDPNDALGTTFNPVTIALNHQTAEFLSSENAQGLGLGIRDILYKDDPSLHGSFSIFIQIEKLNNNVNVEMQEGWRYCNKCQGLFFAPEDANVSNSRCPSGGTHAPLTQSGSGNYSLFHNATADPSRQDQWRWCNKCQGLFFGPQSEASVCPAGGTHTHPAISRSGNYGLPHNVREDSSRQDQWRWCNKCQGLFFGPQSEVSVCPAGGTHTHPAISRSGNYGLPHRPR
ncbi:hypothetical protein [Methyloglobulus sp.]|uniref:hypothetical protein n=1 Tax=Methyloglobulus sp. TaxID=2518622 RepID=UPI0032B84BEE